VPTTSLFLQTHAFLCRGTRHWVILDVNRDKYLCVSRRQFDSLGPWLQGWEETAAQPECSAAGPCEEARVLADKLLSLEILSESADGAKHARPITYPSPTEQLDADRPTSSIRSSCAYAPLFFLSAARASTQLQNRAFRSIVASARARKPEGYDPGSAQPARDRPLDIEHASYLMAVFDSLRLFYPRPYLCLFDSLALVNFLARFDMYPDWVFGVMSDPFEAHCWVQSGNVVLNDTIERVSAFTPIMYV
jgi:Transglutaminase-like superfamily